MSNKTACQRLVEDTNANEDELTSSEIAIFKMDFDDFDTNKSGFLDIDEIIQLLRRQLSREPSQIEANAMLMLFDTNEDNMVSFNEYMEHVVGKGWGGYQKLMMRTTVGAPMEADPEAAKEEEAKRAKAATLIQSRTRARQAKKKVAKKRHCTLNKRGRERKREEQAEAKKKAAEEDAELEAMTAQRTQDRLDAARAKQAATKAGIQASLQ